MTIMRSQLKNITGNFFLVHWDLNYGPLKPKASVLPMSYADPFNYSPKFGLVKLQNNGTVTPRYRCCSKV